MNRYESPELKQHKVPLQGTIIGGYQVIGMRHSVPVPILI